MVSEKRRRLTDLTAFCKRQRPAPAAEDAGSLCSERELLLDEDDRVPCEGLDYGFRVFPRLFSSWSSDTLARLRGDAAAAAYARASAASQFVAADTYWVGATATPENSLEELALAIFRLHTAGATFDAERSGVEWWTVVVGGSLCDEAVGWHWDKDYGLEEDARLSVHPHLATVTYLSEDSAGAPTVVCDRCCGAESRSMEGPITVVHVSYPKVGKHIVFDGRHLHAAPKELALREQKPQGAEKRVTFLVNVWLNHRPLKSTPYRIAGRLWHGGNPLSTGPPAALLPERGTVTELSSTHSASEALEWPLPKGTGADRREHDDQDSEEAEEEQPRASDRVEDTDGDAKQGYVIRMRLPYKHLKRLALEGKADSFTVRMAPGASSVCSLDPDS